jgi:auxin efflux carrier family protein
MAFFRSPTSFRLSNDGPAVPAVPAVFPRRLTDAAFGSIQTSMTAGSGSHPALGHLVLLVFEAVMEVVCVSLPGYIVARQGMFDAEKQKFVANLNVALFTPCLSTPLR